MSNTVYTIPIADAQPNIIMDQLQAAIALTFPTIMYIETDDTNIIIYFSSVLSPADLITLHDIVVNFQSVQPPSDNYITPIYYRTIVTTPTYSVLPIDSIIGVQYTDTAPVTVILPLISTIVNGQTFSVTDEGGNAFNNNITILSSTGNTIIGFTSIIINMNYMSLGFYSNGVDKWLLR